MRFSFLMRLEKSVRSIGIHGSMMTLRHQPSISRNFWMPFQKQMRLRSISTAMVGSVDQGTAIYNMLQQHGSYKTGIVMGGCHSIAFTILQACDKRIMGQGTTAIIHDMWETVTGNAADLRAEADNLDVAMDSCVALFMQRATVSEEELRGDDA